MPCAFNTILIAERVGLNNYCLNLHEYDFNAGKCDRCFHIPNYSLLALTLFNSCCANYMSPGPAFMNVVF